MYCVYKITNLINQKIYIGSSIDYKRRWAQHKNNSLNPNSKTYYYPLYCAFRKYGIENFSFEVISTDFNSIEDMQNYEHNMIIQYNSLENGYNQTLNTNNILLDENLRRKELEKRSQKCAQVDKNNKIIEIYDSYNDAARKNNEPDQANSIRKVCKGEHSSWHGLYFRDIDNNNQIILKPFKNFKNRKAIIGIPLDSELEDVYFESILSASKQLQICRSSIMRCIQGQVRYSNVAGYIWRELDINGNIIENDININDLINEYDRTHPLINGERKTITEWCKIYNISRPSVYNRIKKGLSIIEAITKEKER